MAPLVLRGAVPSKRLETATALGLPGARKKFSTNCWVGVETLSDPTLTVPPAPTIKPCGLANHSLPPIRPSLIEFRTPSILVRSSRTMLMRLAALEGTCRLVVVAARTLKA